VRAALGNPACARPSNEWLVERAQQWASAPQCE
jgi:hypothetical protein